MNLLRIINILIIAAVVSISASAKDFTVVIDPGHGGHDYGAVGNSANEKSINLAVALKLGKLISDSYKDVKVIYTRSTDVFIPLNDRAKIANKNKGDLFISIHVNSVDRKSKNRQSVAGAEVYTLGLHKSEENLAVAKRENSVMALEADYSETYKGFDPNSVESYIIFELTQSRHLEQSISFAISAENELNTTANRVKKGIKQAGFWVLWATGMPSVLVELDFICNPTSEKFLNSTEGQDKMAQALYNAFSQYYTSTPGYAGNNKTQPSKNNLSNQSTQKKASANDKKNQNQISAVTDDNTESKDDSIDYRIQILAHDNLLDTDSKTFKGLKNIEWYIDGGLYKYTTGHYKSLKEAQNYISTIRKKFPQAFIIKTKNGIRVLND